LENQPITSLTLEISPVLRPLPCGGKALHKTINGLGIPKAHFHEFSTERDGVCFRGKAGIGKSHTMSLPAKSGHQPREILRIAIFSRSSPGLNPDFVVPRPMILVPHGAIGGDGTVCHGPEN
jgi:hypothetical protein